VSRTQEQVYTCGRAAHWLPRTLAGALLLAGLLAAARVDPEAAVSGSRRFRALVVLAGAVLALWVVRKGGEVRQGVVSGDDALEVRYGARSRRLAYADVDAIRWDGPFGAGRSWLPAAVLVDREGREWRLCSLLQRGERLLGEIVERSRRPALATWAAEYRVGRRLARTGLRLIAGYAGSALVLTIALAYYLH